MYFKGRVPVKTYNSIKPGPVKFGLKMFSLSNSSTGYAYTIRKLVFLCKKLKIVVKIENVIFLRLPYSEVWHHVFGREIPTANSSETSVQLHNCGVTSQKTVIIIVSS
jgi:hypothetical protein